MVKPVVKPVVKAFVKALATFPQGVCSAPKVHICAAHWTLCQGGPQSWPVWKTKEAKPRRFMEFPSPKGSRRQKTQIFIARAVFGDDFWGVFSLFCHATRIVLQYILIKNIYQYMLCIAVPHRFMSLQRWQCSQKACSKCSWNPPADPAAACQYQLLNKGKGLFQTNGAGEVALINVNKMGNYT